MPEGRYFECDQCGRREDILHQERHAAPTPYLYQPIGWYAVRQQTASMRVDPDDGEQDYATLDHLLCGDACLERWAEVR